MSANEIAFFIGLFGSVHCVGMCGPLAFALPSGHHGVWWLIWDKVVYNLGRIVTYGIIGLLIGLLGKQIWLAGAQQALSIVSGTLVLFVALSRLIKHSWFKPKAASMVLLPFNKLMTYALTHKAGHFVIGILNGLLPCGFVYLALIGALNTSSAMAAAQFMVCFGFGTFPLMLLATVGSQLFTQPARRKLNGVIPYFMLFLGAWFILRGLNLNIPYLSPNIKSAAAICR